MYPITIYSDRVENYYKYRPDYPRELIDFLSAEFNLGLNTASIADIGSGTGIFTRLLLSDSYKVYAIEPNKEMRETAERLLLPNQNFHSIAGTAENTTLEENSIDLIVVAQAFHWFKMEEARREFERILTSSGSVALIWNQRDESGTEFLTEYEGFVQKFCPKYKEIKAYDAKWNSVVKDFFCPNFYSFKLFSNHQDLDYDGLEGRLLSCSYAPNKTDSNFHPMLEALAILYSRHAVRDQIRINYKTYCYFGKL